ncbi:MAG: toxin-antitoxin system YwqK family antitoxin [Sphingobacteriales bacterium]|jgi:antitoxin component YwqK of YwqJK toxin-antitoxin module|nr:toxin-antitoxin system YwqK family antitoxin [Sphingobacteriales bacterium]MBP9142507.1 toxin-antitoxin system YwqK family antitoxin [Chitinophagales bacterium]MDA0199412.1 toxin-antitoxin system YwqK family antitoxin [Bacteroidota bacterium]MBK6890656.1 toxin-antitoxin system YwqK family antitoxin [Sphingobacteriales bacterium]MBK7526291.1 toxin-antitoxin system YwqK family antitoxin [Sphingobacteriales bacterium]
MIFSLITQRTKKAYFLVFLGCAFLFLLDACSQNTQQGNSKTATANSTAADTTKPANPNRQLTEREQKRAHANEQAMQFFEKTPYKETAQGKFFKGIGNFSTFDRVINYHPNGQYQTTFFVRANDTIKDGKYTKYYSNGVVEEEGNYLSGKKHGQWLAYYYTDAGAEPIEEKIEFWEHGVKDGESLEKHKNGRARKQVFYKMGKEEGIGRTWFPTGQVESEVNFKNGKRDGESKAYYANGKLQAVSMVKNGQKEGLTEDYYETGIKRRAIHYKNGKRNGEYKVWNEQGELKVIGEYKNGETIKEITY